MSGLVGGWIGGMVGWCMDGLIVGLMDYRLMDRRMD